MNVREIAAAPLRARAWRELAYVLIGLAVTLPAFALTMLGLYGSALLAVTYVGLLLMAAMLAGLRRLGALYRALDRWFGGEPVAAPAPPPARPGRFGWVRANLSSSIAWRALAYVLLKFLVLVLAALVVLGLWAQSFIALISPILWTYHLDEPFPRPYDHWPMPLVLSLQGLVGVVLAPHAVHAVVLLDRALIRWLLGPTEATERVHDLERTRARAVEDAAATLRRIERDLHDGAQARLVGLGMNLTMIADELRADPIDVDAVRGLVDRSRAATKSAIAELRDLVRGIHPPALDTGLEPALRTVCANSAVPTRLTVALPERPGPAIETIGYFCVAELVANAGKHSGASRCRIAIRRHRDRVLLEVTDDGRGGAAIFPGGGLAGLADRVATVDGRIDIDSPPGGPTAVTIDLPMHT